MLEVDTKQTGEHHPGMHHSNAVCAASCGNDCALSHQLLMLRCRQCCCKPLRLA
jgi:hypothetical protein